MSFVLEDGEVVILREDNVTDANNKNVSLLLTNKHIIKITHEFLSDDKDHYYALSRLRENNGNPNILIGKGFDGKTRLELYFEKSQQFFHFKGFMKEQKWESAITKAYKIRMKEIAKAEREPFTVSTIFAPLIDKIDTAKESLFTREKQPVNSKCPKCGAEIKGLKGEEIKCEYCENIFII